MRSRRAALLAVLAAAVLAAAPDDRLSVERYLDWEQVSDPQIAPDGSRIVYTRQWVDVMADRWESSLWVVEADGTKNRFLTKGSAARWSPDGTRIAYLEEAPPGGPQVHVRWMDAEGATSQVTRVTETPSNLRWAPDGRSIAFTMLAKRPDSWKVDLPAPPKGAAWTEAPRLIETRHYRQDRRGFLEDGYVHIFAVPADGGSPRQLTEGSWNVGRRPYGIPDDVGLDWTPDGAEIVFDGLREEDGDERYRESHIYAVSVTSGAIRQITSKKGPWGDPIVSPDGRLIAFVGYDWTPQTYKALELHVMGLDGGSVRRLAPDLDRDPENLRWAADGGGVYFTAEDRGGRNVHFAPMSGPSRRVTEGAHVLSLTSASRRGLGVGLLSSAHEPPDVASIDLSRRSPPQRLTRVNEDVLAGVRLGEVEELWYDSTGGARVQGWLIRPPDFDPARTYPMVLHIHGGPHAMYNVAFSYSFQNLAAGGYLVLYTNPRGSTGYGTAFGNAIDDAYPSVDYDDLMAGVDAALSKGSVDRGRLYVTGVSGGGVLSSWIIGHTERFAAAAVRAPVINWISFAGTTDITAWGYARFRGRFWEDPQRWLRFSPLMYAGRVKTPTLLMTGELDLRTPMGQTEEYYQALKAAGVPTALLRFNGEYHGTGSKPSNFIRTQAYLMSWFDRHRGGGS